MDNNEFQIQVEKHFVKLGYKIDRSNWSTDFNWRPDIRLKKGKETLAILIRETDNISENWFQRISDVKSKNQLLFNFVVFKRKPNLKLLTIAKSFGVGVIVLSGSKFITLLESKSFGFSAVPKTIKIKKPKQMQKTRIFISSKQIIPERKVIEKLIKSLEKEDHFPIYPVKVEDDPRWGGTNSETLAAINDNLQNSDWFIGVLADEYRKWVNMEFRLAVFKYFEPKYIIMYVKTNKATSQSWQKLLDWLQKNQIKYLPYSSSKDLKAKLKITLLKKIQEIHDKLKIKMY